jgi:hypothetical protein
VAGLVNMTMHPLAASGGNFLTSCGAISLSSMAVSLVDNYLELFVSR